METINESIFKALKISEFSKIPFLFIGNPGTGKTTTRYEDMNSYC